MSVSSKSDNTLFTVVSLNLNLLLNHLINSNSIFENLFKSSLQGSYLFIKSIFFHKFNQFTFDHLSYPHGAYETLQTCSSLHVKQRIVTLLLNTSRAAEHTLSVHLFRRNICPAFHFNILIGCLC